MWTVREGQLLDEAVAYCKNRGLEFYAVNKNYPEEMETHEGYSRKLQADLFIDDRNLGGLPDWGTIYRMIHENKTWADILQEELEVPKPERRKNKWWPF